MIKPCSGDYENLKLPEGSRGERAIDIACSLCLPQIRQKSHQASHAADQSEVLLACDRGESNWRCINIIKIKYDVGEKVHGRSPRERERFGKNGRRDAVHRCTHIPRIPRAAIVYPARHLCIFIMFAPCLHFYFAFHARLLRFRPCHQPFRLSDWTTRRETRKRHKFVFMSLSTVVFVLASSSGLLCTGARILLRRSMKTQREPNM
jgi:hypothetical protein